jgi:predicted double-glycine peptidase
VDHYITVLDVTDKKVIIAGPIAGRYENTYEQFRNKWRFVGIVVKKEM